MPGGPAEAWETLGPILKSIAAVAEGEPCVTHVGTDGAGHFVKMVHNGIEYADMQLIANPTTCSAAWAGTMLTSWCRSSSGGTRATSSRT
jgi:6-phosphogluconate dehydrogenase